MANYRDTPLKICASSTGGADVDVSATLFVDRLADKDGDVTLVDVDQLKKCAALKAHKDSGKAQLRLVFRVAPMLGNGEFKATVELTHPAIEGDPFFFTKRGRVAQGVPTSFDVVYDLP